MHGVRRQLLELQAESLKMQLRTVELPEQPSMSVYEEEMQQQVLKLKDDGYTTAIFGDIFLEDLKNYREQQLSKSGINCYFPIWKKDTRELMNEFIDLGFKAIVVCTNNTYLDSSFCGRLLDESFLKDLPANVDPCGENGEYHSFVFDGPIFTKPIPFTKGEIIIREYATPKSTDDCFTTSPATTGFYFCDLL